MKPRLKPHLDTAPSPKSQCADWCNFAATLPGGCHLAFLLVSGPSCPFPGLVPKREMQAPRGLLEGPTLWPQPAGRTVTTVSLTSQGQPLLCLLEGHGTVAPTGSGPLRGHCETVLSPCPRYVRTNSLRKDREVQFRRELFVGKRPMQRP